MDVKKEVDEVSSVFSQHPRKVRINNTLSSYRLIAMDLRIIGLIPIFELMSGSRANTPWLPFIAEPLKIISYNSIVPNKS